MCRNEGYYNAKWFSFDYLELHSDALVFFFDVGVLRCLILYTSTVSLDLLE